MIGAAPCAQGQSLKPDEVLSTLSLRVVSPPQPVLGADNRIHLAYELLASNTSALFATLDKVDVISDGARVLGTVASVRLAAMMTLPGIVGTRLPPGGSAFIFMDTSFPAGALLPPSIAVRVTLTRQPAGQDGKPGAYPAKAAIPATTEFVGPAIDVGRAPAVVIDPPLRGPRWVALNGCCDTVTSHRGAIMAVNGVQRVGQRFAIDWVQLQPNDVLYTGDRSRLESYAYFGVPVYAVADGTVVNFYNQAQEQVPGAPAIGITPPDIGGNMLVVDIGDGRFAFFAHLKPGSLKVKLGDHVVRGQVLAQVGNTGNSDAPHLHFHVMDGASPLNSNGLPYVFTHFTVRGSIDTETMDGLLDAGKPATVKASATDGPHVRQLPLNLELVDFSQ